MSQPQTYLARVEFGDNHRQETPFLAIDDKAAVAAGRACRKTVADWYCRGFTDQVRVRVLSLELGTWDDGIGFTTSTSRLLLDTWEDDRQTRKPANYWLAH